MDPGFHALGRALIALGLVLATLGALLTFGPGLSWLGRLPGDISISRDGFSLYFPITSCLLISALISLVFWLMKRWR